MGSPPSFFLSFIKELSSTYIWHQLPEPSLSIVELYLFSLSLLTHSINLTYMAFLPEKFMGSDIRHFGL